MSSLMSVEIATGRDQRAILRAADTLFTEHGIDSVALDAVAVAAGLSTTSWPRPSRPSASSWSPSSPCKHQGWARRLETNSEKIG